MKVYNSMEGCPAYHCKSIFIKGKKYFFVLSLVQYKIILYDKPQDQSKEKLYSVKMSLLDSQNVRKMPVLIYLNYFVKN